MFVHLGYRHPQGGVHDVSICRMVPCSAKQLFENCGGTMPTLPIATLESIDLGVTYNPEPLLFFSQLRKRKA